MPYTIDCPACNAEILVTDVEPDACPACGYEFLIARYDELKQRVDERVRLSRMSSLELAVRFYVTRLYQRIKGDDACT